MLDSAIVSRLAVGLLLSAIIGVVAYRRRSLSASGAAGAVLTGTVIFGLGGWTWGLVLIAFFTSSSVLSRLQEERKADLAEKFEKGSRRDLGQVLANSGVASILAVVSAVTEHPLVLYAYCGAMAAVTADTWATEVGVLARRHPRMVTTGRPVQPGTSGGITGLGTLAALLGSVTIGCVAAGFCAVDRECLQISTLAAVAASTVAGLAGALFDSLLGATHQAIYFSSTRDKETERPAEMDGRPNQLIRGHRWLTNDWVNFLSSLVGAAVAAGTATLIR